MNKIYLDKLCEFVLATHKNYIECDKNFNIDDYINGIKQNNSLNEKGIFLKYNFIDLKTIIPQIDYDQLIIINPLSFNIYGHNEAWFNFLNALLTALKDNYIHENNINKKTILEIADKTYKKKMVIDNKLDDNVFNSVCSSTNFILIIISQNNIDVYNKKLDDIKLHKVVVMFKHVNEYFPIINWNQKYFNKNNQFINYLFELYDKQNKNNNSIDTDNLNNNNNLSDTDNLTITNENKFIKVEKKKNKSEKNIVSNSDNGSLDFDDNDISTHANKDKYEELMTNEDYALYISEAVNDDDIKKKNINLSDTKKKIKKSKNIFVSNNDESLNIPNTQKNNENNSVFNKTEKISKKDIDDINNNLKPSQTLEQIQSYALKVGINIFSGSTKTGKPKNKTKSDLIIELKNLAINYK